MFNLSTLRVEQGTKVLYNSLVVGLVFLWGPPSNVVLGLAQRRKRGTSLKPTLFVHVRPRVTGDITPYDRAVQSSCEKFPLGTVHQAKNASVRPP